MLHIKSATNYTCTTPKHYADMGYRQPKQGETTQPWSTNAAPQCSFYFEIVVHVPRFSTITEQRTIPPRIHSKLQYPVTQLF